MAVAVMLDFDGATLDQYDEVTREQFERFAAEKIGPTTQGVGFPNPPDVKFVEVHNYLTAA